MSTLNIMLQDRDAVTEFVAATTSMPFDMDLVQGSRVVDAKSLLGILYMGLGKVLNLKLDTEHLPTAKQTLHVRKAAPLGDPIEITVRGYELSVRKADAEMVQVETK